MTFHKSMGFTFRNYSHFKMAVICAHSVTLPPPCLTYNVLCFGLWTAPFLPQTFLFSSFWYKVFGFICTSNLTLDYERLYLEVFWLNLIRLFLFLNATNGLHLVVNPLHLHWWRCFLIVDFDNDAPIFSKGVLTSIGIVKDSTIIHFSCPPGLLCCGRQCFLST